MPDASDKGVRFIGSTRDCINGIMGMDEGIDDTVKGNDGEVSVQNQPLDY